MGTKRTRRRAEPTASWRQKRKQWLGWFVGWLLAGVIWLLYLTCRVRIYGDPRPALRRAKRRYVYAHLHAHQLGALFAGDPGTATMVSKSADGNLIVPALIVFGIRAVRGSSLSPRHVKKRQDSSSKGGLSALATLSEHLKSGRGPVFLTVDGPRGPRGRVHGGIAQLARKSDAVVLVATPVARRRWVLRRSWDRLQIPAPFTTIDWYFAPPIDPRAYADLATLREAIQDSLAINEGQVDPLESRPADGKLRVTHQSKKIWAPDASRIES